MPDIDGDYDPHDEIAKHDYSRPTDFSVGSGYKDASYADLQKRELDPGQQHETDITSPNSLSKQEHGQANVTSTPSAGKSLGGVASKTNPMNYIIGGRGGRSQVANAKTKIRRIRITVSIIASILGGGGIGLSSLLPGLLPGKIGDVISKRFIAPSSKVSSSHTKSLWKCKLSLPCMLDINKKTKATGDSGDGLGQISDEAKAAVKANGGDVTAPSSDGGDGNIKMAGGDKVGTGTGGTVDIDNMPPAIENDFIAAAPANNGDHGATSGTPTGDMLKITGANKNIPLEDDVGDDKDGKPRTIQEQLDAQAEAEKELSNNKAFDPSKSPALSSDLTVQNAKTISPDADIGWARTSSSSDDASKSKAQTGFMESNGGTEDVESSSRVISDAEEKIKGVSDKVEKSGGNAAEAALNIACAVATTADGAMNAYRLGVKLIKIVQLSRMAWEVMTVLNSINANDGSNRSGHNGPTPEQFSQTMDSITTVLKDDKGNVTTKSGTDSFGYQAAAGYLVPGNNSDNKFDIADTSNAAAPGMPTKFTATAVANSDSGDRSLLGMILNSAPSVPGNGFIVSKILNSGCSAIPLIFGAIKTLRAGSDVANALEPTGITQIIALADVLSQVGGFISSLLPSGTAANTISWASAILGAGSSCAGAITSAGAGAGGCLMSLLSIGMMIAMPHIIQAVIDHFTKDFLKNPMPVGSDKMDAVTSGMGASMGINSAMNSVPVVGSGNGTSSDDYSGYVEINKELLAYNQHQDALSRAKDSPFDIYNNATFLGSIMGDFAVGLYANGNSPLDMAQSLLGMFGSSFASITRGNSAYADAASTAYASSCTDHDVQDANIAADPFCNPIYGLADSDNMDPQSTVNAITSPGWGDCQASDGSVNSSQNNESSCASAGGAWKSAIDPTAAHYNKNYGVNTDANIPGSSTKTIGGFLSECVTRNSNGSFTPMGVASDDGGMQNGKDCIIADSPANDQSSYGRSNLITLYNYTEYFLANSNINQGSNLGAQADGSA